jgi:hypothetical protein
MYKQGLGQVGPAESTLEPEEYLLLDRFPRTFTRAFHFVAIFFGGSAIARVSVDTK